MKTTDDHQSHKKALVAAIREVQATKGWLYMYDELWKIKSIIEARILDMPVREIDNTPRYTELDILRERRRIVRNFIDLPEDLADQMTGSWEEIF